MADGADELRALAKFFRGADDKMKVGLKSSTKKGAVNVKASARALAAVRGVPRLAGAITFDITDGGFGAEIGPDKDKSGLGVGVEFGSSGTPPHPYMFPAGDLEEPRFFQAVEDVVAKAYEL